MVRAFLEDVLRGRARAGRLVDHPAGGEEPGPLARADAAPQGAGDHPGAAALARSSRRKRCSRSTSTRSTTGTAATAARRRRATSSASRCATSTWPRRRCWPACRRARSASRRAAPRGRQDAAALRARADGGARLHRPRHRRSRGGRADPAGARAGLGARHGRRGGRRRRRRAGREAGRVGGDGERHHRHHHARRPPAGAGAHRRSSAGSRISTRARGSAGPSGHLTGKAARRAAATSWCKAHAGGLGDSEIVEGIVTRVEPDPKNAKLGHLYVDAGVREAGHEALSRRRRAGRARRSEDQGAAAELAVRRGAGGGEGGGQGGGGRPRARAPLRQGDEAARRAVQARRSGARAPAPPTARTPRARPFPLALELGPQAAMVVLDPTHARDAGAGGRLRLPLGRLRPQPARQPPAGLGVQADRLRGGDRGQEDHPGDDHQRRARGLRSLEAAELREGRVPRPGARAHRAGRFDQHRRDQGPVRRRDRPGARGRDARRHHLADRARRRAVAGARLADGDAARAGQRLRHLRRRRPGGQGRPRRRWCSAIGDQKIPPPQLAARAAARGRLRDDRRSCAA